ncbi:MAG TPA: polyphosphate kinase 2 family protein [Polyangiaceae bacterium]|nr:polyphosphate kinase 2 family protein [Polyangiaceae bacterium]
MKTDRFMVRPGKDFKLRKLSSSDTGGVKNADEAAERLEKGVRKLADLQDKLYAHDKYGILLIFQAMDAAGKDSTIKHVMSGVNPQGCQVFSFKNPSPEELDHDFMWRSMKCLPERGRIGIFNRSYYEEVLVVRVHPEFLGKQKLPPPPKGAKDIWKRRFEDINNIEQYFVNNGIIPIKFFLNVSKDEQLARFLKRLDDPHKVWKFSENDVLERALWDKYQDAYEDMLRNTSTRHAPWYVIPADHKWYMRLAVSEIINQRLEELRLQYPDVDAQRREELERVRIELGGPPPAAKDGDGKRKKDKKKGKNKSEPSSFEALPDEDLPF